MADKRYLFRGFHPDKHYMTLVGKDTIILDEKVIHGEWVKGYLRNATTIDEYHEIDIDDVTVEVFVRSCSVLPETIGQYTGLTDLNDKKIFQNDIVRWGMVDRNGIKKVCENTIRVAVVEFNPDIQYRCLNLNYTFHHGNFIYADYTDVCLEVIGNIFEGEVQE